MKLHSPEFERRLRERIEPQWKAERKRCGAVGRSFWVRHHTLHGTGLVVIVSLVAAVFVRVPRVSGWEPDAAAAVVGIVMTAVMIALCGIVRAHIERPPALGMLLWLPAADETIAQAGWSILWRVRWQAWLSLMILLPALAWTEGGSLAFKLCALVVVSALGAAATAGVLVLPFPKKASLLAAGFLFFLFIALFARSPWLLLAIRELMERYGAALDWLHPGGWIVGLWHAALAGRFGQSEWWLAVPMFALGESTRYWYRRHRNALRSEKMLEEVHWTPAPLDEDAQEQGAAAEAQPPEVGDAAELRESWRKIWPPIEPENRIERWLVARLSAREVLLCQTLMANLISLGKLVRWGCLTGAAVWCLAWAGRALHWTSGWLIFLIGGLGFIYLCAVVSFGALPFAGSIAAWFPVGYREIRRLEWKLGWPVLAMMSPFLLVIVAALTWSQGLPALDGAVRGVKVVLLAAGFQPVLVLIRFSAGTSDSTRLSWSSLRIMANLLLVCLAGCGGIASLFIEEWPGWVLVLVVWLTTWRFYAVHRRQWDRRKFDIGGLAAGVGGR